MNRMKLGGKEGGFTLVELTLSMGFVGSLLIIITLTTMQFMSIYNKGLTIKEVNNVSRVVVRDMQQSVAGVNAFLVSYNAVGGESEHARSLVDARDKQQQYYEDPANGGRLCTGSYSYAWNYSSALNGMGPGGAAALDEDQPIQYLVEGSDKVPIRFVRVLDPSYVLCSYTDNEGGELPDMAPNKYLNVFGEGNNNLALYTFEIDTPLNSPISLVNDGAEERVVKSDVSSMSTFYRVKFTLGTQMGDEHISGVDSSCKPPSESTFNKSEYCAINVIEFVARTSQL